MIQMKKAEELEKVEREMAADKTLPLQEANLVFGEGDSESRVVFIGEAPGFEEDKQVRPFVGRSGQLLRKNIRDIGWKEENVYITNIVKRRPPANRDPSPDEIEAYKPYLTRQLEIIKPKIVVTLGRFSMNYFLPEAKISLDHGKVFRFDGFLLYPIYHPAAALRSTGMKDEFEDNFKKLPKILEKAGELLAKSKQKIEKEEKTEQEKLF